METINYLTDNLTLLSRDLQNEPNVMNDIAYRNWFYDMCDFIYMERKDMKKIFNEFIEKTNRYGWIDRIDKIGNRIELKINFHNNDIFNVSILCLKRSIFIMFTDNEFYGAIQTSDIDLIIKQIIKIVKIRNYDLIETYKDIGVDLINY